MMFDIKTIGIGLAVVAVLATATAAPAGQSSVDRARQATAKYRHLSVAKKDGYGLLRDAKGIACIDNPGVGGMGVHYANSALVGDGKVNVRTPDVLVYDPGPNGTKRLVALEYVVFQKAWDAHHSRPPKLYGRTFELLKAGNRYGLDAFYELHAWVWKHNSRGMFDDWNPAVKC